MTNGFTPETVNNNEKNKLSPEEWKAQKQAEKDEVFKMIDEAAVEVASSPEAFMKYLATQSNLDRYSATNALLMYKQCPEATVLKEFSDWGKDNVKIKKGMKNLRMLEPVEYTKQNGTTGINFNVKRVFDISQTTSKPKMTYDFTNEYAEKLANIMISTCPVKVEMVDSLEKNAGAYYDHSKQTLFVRKVSDNYENLIEWLSCELAHVELALKNPDYDRNASSFEALSVCYMLCKKQGVPAIKDFVVTKTPKEFLGDKPKEIRAKLSTIKSAYSDIHSRITSEFYRQKQERSKDMER